MRMDRRRFNTALAKYGVNPFVKAMFKAGIAAPGTAILETTGRKSGKPRTTPVTNGLDGDVFWIVTEHGWAADYVKNIAHDPRVRIKLGRRWLSGTATILELEDSERRLQELHRPVNDALLRLVGTQQLVIRVDLDRATVPEAS